MLRRVALVSALSVLALANNGAGCDGDDPPATPDAAVDAAPAIDAAPDAASCAAVECVASHPGCVAGTCEPATGRCSDERCVEDAPALYSGTIIGIQYGPLADAGVLVTSATGSVSASPAADGTFTIAVPYHESDLRVSRPGFADYTQHLVFGPDERSEGNEIQLQPTLAWYDVTVWQAVNTPLPGANVMIAYQGGTGAAGITDGLGRVTFTLQPVGEPFTLRVTAQGAQPFEGHPDPLTPGSNTIIVGLY